MSKLDKMRNFDKMRKLTKEEEISFKIQIEKLRKRARKFAYGYKLRMRTDGQKLSCQMKLQDGWVNACSKKL